QFETRPRPLECDDLAVDGEVGVGVSAECFGQRREARIEAQGVARQPPQPATVPDRDAADSVELSLEYPRGVAERLAAEHRLHDLDSLGKRRGPQPGTLGVRQNREGI